jgi:hypothetical protein
VSIFFWPILTIISAILHLVISKKKRNLLRIIEIFLLYMLFIMVGFGSLWAFMGHAFFGDRIAYYIGWKPGSPFQLEVAFANLAFGVLGILCMWFRKEFWLAVVIGLSVFYWGSAYGHIYEKIVNNNYAPGNVGTPIFFDIIVPIVLLTLLFSYRRLSKKNE